MGGWRCRVGMFAVLLVAAGATGSCGSGSESVLLGDGTADDGGGTSNPDSGPTFGDDGGGAHVFDVEPNTLQTIVVPTGATMPVIVYKATLDGQPFDAAWSVDRGDVGTIGTSPGQQVTFRPTGTTGGMATIMVRALGKSVQRRVFVQLAASQNGPNASAPGEAQQIPGSAADLTKGGGVGGVGGEGLGIAVADMPTLTALQAPSGDGKAQGLTFLFPYDKTVFPRGLLAPLLQWNWSIGDADAIQIQLKTTSGSFSWTGTFGGPAVLAQTAGKFIRHPIPQDVWKTATNSAGGATPNNKPDRLVVGLVVAKGGKAYGPITETWTVAPAHLEGTIYYNSYGTHYVQNSGEASNNHGPEFGAAVLGVAQGATSPSVVAGTTTPGSKAGCRVCHVVASDGSRLIVQHGDQYGRTSIYDLKNGSAEIGLTAYDNLFDWAGLSTDGSLAFTNAAELGAGTAVSSLYAFPPTSKTPLAVTGISNDLQAGTPVFSTDTKHVAFDFLGGTIGTSTGNGTQLVALDFDRAHNSFSNLKVLATMTGGKRAGFPTFFPTNDAVAFHYQIVNASHRYDTTQGAEAQIWWSDLATGKAASLAALNGLNVGGTTSYLPTGPNNHADDTVLNYEPTVNPVASGGYLWVIFTSRRLYGNVATTDPWQSDPRNYDATTLANATTKKLWVAAIDMNAPPGTDPSHPAFYLPAQELLAGNARGFWALEPCKANGVSCESGDQCCNGYCELGVEDAGLVCVTNPNALCSQPQEKCAAATDCCDSSNMCVNGFCSFTQPK